MCWTTLEGVPPEARMDDLEDDFLTLHEDILEENEEGIREILGDFKENETVLLQLCTREVRIQDCDPEWGESRKGFRKMEIQFVPLACHSFGKKLVAL